MVKITRAQLKVFSNVCSSLIAFWLVSNIATTDFLTVVEQCVACCNKLAPRC